jgi:hypothetical protein
VASSEARKAAADLARGPLEIVQLGGKNCFEANSNPAKIQANRLLRRFKWSPARAALTAELAFGEAR